MKLAPNLQEAVFISRLNRFAALFELNGQRVTAHVPNSGRMKELLIPGTPMFLTPASKEGRKTAYDLILTQLEHTLVSADARLPNQLVHEALEACRLAEFTGYRSIKREVVYGESRLDLLLSGEKGLCYIETKSVTLVENGVGLFPDAPTDRGRKHMRSLASAIAEGHRGAVIFVIQRSDASSFAPNDTADPKFGQALREAVRQGVEAYAYRCAVSKDEVLLSSQIPVRL